MISSKTSEAPTTSNAKSRPCWCWILSAGIVVVVFGIVAFTLCQSYTNLWGDDIKVCHPGDQISVRNAGLKMNTILCAAYSVSPSSYANVYRIPSQAKYSTQHRTVFLTDSGLSFKSSYDYGVFYLLPGSQIHATACSGENTGNVSFVPVEVMVFKGQDSWEAWTGGKASAALQYLILTKSDSCSNGSYKALKVSVIDADNYYMVLTRQSTLDSHIPVSLTLNLTFHRTMYDLTGAVVICDGTKSNCTVDVPLKSDPDIVLQFSDEQSGTLTGSSVQFAYKCNVRLLFWMGVFLILPLGLIALMVAVFYCCCFNSVRPSTLKRQQSESQAGLVNGVSPPSYESVSWRRDLVLYDDDRL